MQQNPLLSYLMRKSWTSPLWLTVIFTIGVFAFVVASMKPGLAAMMTKNDPMPESEAWLLIAALLALVGAPMMVGVNAAAFTVRHAEPAHLKKIKLGNLSRGQLMWAYTLSTLHRLQIVLAVVVGLSPALAIGLTEFVISAYQLTHPDASTPAVDATQWLVINGLMVFGVVGFNVMGAALGAASALTWNKPLLSTSITVAGMALATAFYVTLALTVNLNVPAALGAAIAPYAITAVLIALVSRGRPAAEE